MNHRISQPPVTGLQEIPDELDTAETDPARGAYVVRALGRREARRLWRALHPEKRRAERRRYRVRRQARERTQVFAHYGTSCACCGATEKLTIDHVNGDGAEHRREMDNRGGYRTYHWLVVNGFPPGFQSLCEPCNISKGRGRACRLDHNEKQDRRDAPDAGRSLIAC